LPHGERAFIANFRGRKPSVHSPLADGPTGSRRRPQRPYLPFPPCLIFTTSRKMSRLLLPCRTTKLRDGTV
jgi:hypothetical protein